MSARGVFRDNEANRVSFWCPGCGEFHTLNIGPGSPSWKFNGDYDKPTFQPSVLIRSGHFVAGHKPGVDSCWCTYNAEHPDDPSPYTCTACHSFVTDGNIQFLSDSTHKLSGQTVPLTVAPVRRAIES